MVNKLEEYAHLVIEIGLNVQKGQYVIINSPVECAPFARLCVKAAYEVGAKQVIMNWRDDAVAREYWLNAADECFDEVFPWDHLDCGVTKNYLLREWHKALKAECTQDCRKGCTGCGMKRYPGACENR